MGPSALQAKPDSPCVRPEWLLAIVSLLYFAPSASAESEAIQKFLSQLETGK